MSDLVFVSGDLATLGVIPIPKMLLLGRFLKNDLIWFLASEAAGSKGGKSSRFRSTSELIVLLRGLTVGSSGVVGGLGKILAGVLAGALSGSPGAMGVANAGGAAVVAVEVAVPA